MDYSLPGSSGHGIFQVRILEWVAIPFSRRSSQPRDWTRVYYRQVLYHWATKEAGVQDVPHRNSQAGNWGLLIRKPLGVSTCPVWGHPLYPPGKRDFTWRPSRLSSPSLGKLLCPEPVWLASLSFLLLLGLQPPGDPSKGLGCSAILW